jgi:hypothetical protein
MRKELDITISDEGRDQGKVFHLREFPASKAEKWAMQALMLAARSGVDLPDNIGPAMGMQGIAMLGIQAIMKVNFLEAEPLLNEMMACVSIKPDPQRPEIVRGLVEDDIEEIATRVMLRSEVIKLHVNFSGAANPSKSTSETLAPAFSNTPTSPAPLAPSSQRAKHR